MDRFSYNHYELQFRKSLQTSKGPVYSRTGFWLRAEIDKQSYFGEAAPLPGFSRESLEQVQNFLRQSGSKLSAYLSKGFEQESTDKIDSLIESYSAISDVWEGNTPPASLHFALDSILFQYWLRNQDIRHAPVALNVLATNLDDVDSAVQAGFKTVKIKIGIDEEKEFRFLSDIRASWPDLNIRLDANQAFTDKQAAKFIPRYATFMPEYIEDPFRSFGLSALHQRDFKVAFAADESLRSVEDLNEYINKNYCEVFIIKPMMINGLSKTLSIISKAVSGGKKVILTTSLDSGLARRTYALLASMFLSDFTHGIATGNLLHTDSWTDEHLIENGLYHSEIHFRQK